MYTSPELVTLIQQERERALLERSQARLAACVAVCSSGSFVGRAARLMRLAPASC